MNETINNFSKPIKSILILLIYLILPSISYKIVNRITGLSLYSSDTYDVVVIELLLDLISFIVFFMIYRKKIVKDFNISISSILKLLEDILLYYIIFSIVNYFVSYLVVYIYDLFGINYQAIDNQISIEEMFKSAPRLIFIDACVMAPLIEETVFRASIRVSIKNNGVFISISGLIFGIAHISQHMLTLISILIMGIIIDYIVNMDISKKLKIYYVGCAILITCLVTYLVLSNIYGFNTLIQEFKLSELIGSISYISAGMVLAYVYVKKNNLILNASIHSLNNVMSFISLLIH